MLLSHNRAEIYVNFNENNVEWAKYKQYALMSFNLQIRFF